MVAGLQHVCESKGGLKHSPEYYDQRQPIHSVGKESAVFAGWEISKMSEPEVEADIDAELPAEYTTDYEVGQDNV